MSHMDERLIEVKIAVYPSQLAAWKAAASEARVSFREWLRQAGDEKLERESTSSISV